MFKGLSVIAGSFLTGLALYVQQNDSAKSLINKLFQEMGLNNNEQINAGFEQLFKTPIENKTEEVKNLEDFYSVLATEATKEVWYDIYRNGMKMSTLKYKF